MASEGVGELVCIYSVRRRGNLSLVSEMLLGVLLACLREGMLDSGSRSLTRDAGY